MPFAAFQPILAYVVMAAGPGKAVSSQLLTTDNERAVSIPITPFRVTHHREFPRIAHVHTADGVLLIESKGRQCSTSRCRDLEKKETVAGSSRARAPARLTA